MNVAQPIKDMRLISELMDVYKVGSKNHLLIAFGLNTALRISDILKTKVGMVKGGIWQERETKTNKRRIIELNPKLQLLIRDYVDKHKLNENDYLFYSNKNKARPITRSQAHRIIANAGDMIDITPLSAHSLRKSWAYHCYHNGVSLDLLQFMLNHSSSTITAIYCSITQSEANKVYESIAIGL